MILFVYHVIPYLIACLYNIQNNFGENPNETTS